MSKDNNQDIRWDKPKIPENCPNCGQATRQSVSCHRCGLYFFRYYENLERERVLTTEGASEIQPPGHLKGIMGRANRLNMLFALIIMFLIMGVYLGTSRLNSGSDKGFANANGLKENHGTISFDETDELTVKGKKYFQEGILSGGRKDIIGAAGKFKEALEYFNRVKDERLIAITNYNLGSSYRILKKYQDSLDCFQRSVDMARKNRLVSIEAKALRSTGLVYYHLNLIDDGLRYIEESFALHSGINNREAISDCLIMGAIENKRHPGRAGAYFKRALEISKEIGDRLGELNSSRLLEKCSNGSESQKIEFPRIPPGFENI